MDETLGIPERGTPALFSGFPHGYQELLIHQAKVSGPASQGFHLDGAVNSGNSGGPVIKSETNEVVGIVTFKRFVSPEELRQLERQWISLYQGMDEPQIRVNLGGIFSDEFIQHFVETIDTLRTLIRTNANTGIGGAIDIGYVDSAVDKALEEIKE